MKSFWVERENPFENQIRIETKLTYFKQIIQKNSPCSNKTEAWIGF